MTSSNVLPPQTPLIQLLRHHAGSEANAFAAWLVGLPTLHSLDSLSGGERTTIRARLDEEGAALALEWQAARALPELDGERWMR